jgi:hypothetical protein
MALSAGLAPRFLKHIAARAASINEEAVKTTPFVRKGKTGLAFDMNARSLITAPRWKKASKNRVVAATRCR